VIQLKSGQYLVQDMGSTRGTRINDRPVEGQQPLKDGDALLLGDILFRVAISSPEVQAQAQLQTRLLEAQPAAGLRVGADRASTEEQLQEIEAAPTAYGSKTVVNQAPPPKNVAVAETRINALALDTAARPARAVAPAPSPAGAAPVSVAERARRRRQAGTSLAGQIVFRFKELPRRVKIIGGSVLGALVLGGLVFAMVPESTAKRGPEPERLTAKPLPDSFGYGEGVTWSRPDMKVFSLQFFAPTRVVAVLHYQALDVSDGEVSIALNGNDLGFVPADTADVNEREIELVLPPKALKRNALNQLIFDNVRNPPGHETWRIWNLWLEVIPVPELPEEELISEANDDATKAKELFDLREVGPENLFKAWKGYRNAWVTLEALEHKPELYDLVRNRMITIGRQLNTQCARMMLDVLKSMQTKNRRKARQTLEDVARYFPTTEHRCHNLALEKMNQYEL
jgi:hypothetical protein